MISTVVGCDSLLNNATEAKQAEISEVDGQHIVNLDADGLYSSDYFGKFRDRLATDYGGAIIQALNRKIRQADIQSNLSIAAKSLNPIAADVKGVSNLPEIGSTHIRITNEEGEVEEFVLTLRPYFYSAQQKAATMNNQIAAMQTGTTWLALDPDRFYLHDDENGEIWPVTFPAVSLEDPSRTIKLTFNRNGFVSSSLGSNEEAATDGSSNIRPNIVFLEAMPVVPHIIQPCEPNDPRPECHNPPPPPPPGTLRIDHYGDGGPTGGFTPSSPYQTYLILETIHLYRARDGDGAHELQMFVIQNDDYDHNMPIAYKYTFDEFWDGALGGGSQITTGADQREYWVADINAAGITRKVYTGSLMCGNQKCEGLPIFQLTYASDPWRFVLTDDDKDYREFNRRQDHEYATDIWTYDMADGSWNQKFTGFTVDSRENYSSDDPKKRSGVRNITLQNVNERLGNTNSLQAIKYYSDGYFAYTFSIAQYDAYN